MIQTQEEIRLWNRAIRAHCKYRNRHPGTYAFDDQVENDVSGLKKLDGKSFVVLRNTRKVVAAYRYDADHDRLYGVLDPAILNKLE